MGNIVQFIFTKIMLYKVCSNFESYLVKCHLKRGICMWRCGKMRVIKIQLSKGRVFKEGCVCGVVIK